MEAKSLLQPLMKRRQNIKYFDMNRWNVNIVTDDAAKNATEVVRTCSQFDTGFFFLSPPLRKWKIDQTVAYIVQASNIFTLLTLI